MGREKDTKAPRIAVDVNDFSELGRTARNRAILEIERRFFKNDTEQTFEEQGVIGKVFLHNRVKGALCLDKRTCCDARMFSKDKWLGAREVLQKGYIDFYVQCKKI